MDQRVIIRNRIDILEQNNGDVGEMIRLYKLLEEIEQRIEKSERMRAIQLSSYKHKPVDFNMITRYIKKYKLALSSYKSCNKKVCPHTWSREQFLLICKLHKQNNKRHRKMFKRQMPGVNLSDILTMDIKILYKNIFNLIFPQDIANIVLEYCDKR